MTSLPHTTLGFSAELHARQTGVPLKGVRCRAASALQRSTAMLDLIMLAIGLGFFALSIGYVYACDRL
jgi:hypothetical protein